MEFIHKLKKIEKLLLNKNLTSGLNEISILINKCIQIQYNKRLKPVALILKDTSEKKLKIYSFGRFTMVLNEKIIIFQKKIQKRPLDLLKAIIITSDQDISKTKLATLLWPNSLGNAQISVMNTTISRLRKIIGKDAVLTENGNISLNKDYCSVDYWQLDEILFNKNISKNLSKKSLLQIFKLYKGNFLPGENHKWIVSKREKIQNKLSLLLSFHSEQLILNKQHIFAIEFLKQCIKIENMDENFYLSLMECQINQNLFQDAMKTFHSYQINIKPNQNIIISDKMEELYQNISYYHETIE